MSFSLELFNHFSDPDRPHFEAKSVADGMFADIFACDKVICGGEPTFGRIHNVGEFIKWDKSFPGIGSQVTLFRIGALDDVVLADRELGKDSISDVASLESNHEV